ncbi:Gibberellin 2-beta-dioxygenase 8 [Platanthera zijinensis]|uniref:Gibberellin 2-beta-dioxygenase 8 n=1 Tax=Platanthera zijinensis TaxID=2320716 RepID=A0AAP0C2B1_9ASPA
MAVDSIVLPVIDLANFPTELDKLAAASTTLGCFRVVNHGLPPALAAEMKAVARSLFESSDEAKFRSGNVDRIYAGGYMFRGEFSKLHESLGIYDAASAVDVQSFCSNLDATIKQRKIISEYIGKVHCVIIDIASKVAESLSCSLAGLSFEEWPLAVRLNFYDFRVEEDIGSSALPAHADSGFLTILQEDECVGGLEIMDRTGNFVSIDPVPAGALLVNIGDVGKAWSNGRLHNMEHRVICRDAIPRISIATFLLAPKDGKVEPNAAFVDADHPKLYQTFMYNEYRKLRTTTGFLAGQILPRLL